MIATPADQRARRQGARTRPGPSGSAPSGNHADVSVRRETSVCEKAKRRRMRESSTIAALEPVLHEQRIDERPAPASVLVHRARRHRRGVGEIGVLPPGLARGDERRGQATVPDDEHDGDACRTAATIIPLLGSAGPPPRARRQPAALRPRAPATPPPRNRRPGKCRATTSA